MTDYKLKIRDERQKPPQVEARCYHTGFGYWNCYKGPEPLAHFFGPDAKADAQAYAAEKNKQAPEREYVRLDSLEPGTVCEYKGVPDTLVMCAGDTHGYAFRISGPNPGLCVYGNDLVRPIRATLLIEDQGHDRQRDAGGHLAWRVYKPGLPDCAGHQNADRTSAYRSRRFACCRTRQDRLASVWHGGLAATEICCCVAAWQQEFPILLRAKRMDTMILSRLDGQWTVYRHGKPFMAFMALKDALECAWMLRRSE